MIAISDNAYYKLVYLFTFLSLFVLLQVVLYLIAQANGDIFFVLFEDGSYFYQPIAPELQFNGCLPFELCSK
jgi:hypothetical protein